MLVTFPEVRRLLGNAKDRTHVLSCQARAAILFLLWKWEPWSVCTELKSRHFCCYCKSGSFLLLEGAMRLLHPRPGKVHANLCSGESNLPVQRAETTMRRDSRNKAFFLRMRNQSEKSHLWGNFRKIEVIDLQVQGAECQADNLSTRDLPGATRAGPSRALCTVSGPCRDHPRPSGSNCLQLYVKSTWTPSRRTGFHAT